MVRVSVRVLQITVKLNRVVVSVDIKFFLFVIWNIHGVGGMLCEYGSGW